MDNFNNQTISKLDIENILNYFGNIGDQNKRLTINNVDNFQKAFIHESYYQAVQNAIMNNQVTDNVHYIPNESNERLEYLGDHILKAVMGKYLYDRFGEEREGFLTKLKIKIEKCSMLHKIGVTLGFKKYLLLSLQVENQTILDLDRGRNCPSYYEDAFEAFVGAIVVEFGEMGYIYADRFVRNVIENTIDFAELISRNDNFKDSLQRYWQHHRISCFKTPTYSALCEEGPLYRKVFTRMLKFTKEQFEQMDSHIKIRIQKYSDSIHHQFADKLDDDLVKQLRDRHIYILGIGYGRKVIQAEQDCAKQCMINLELDLNY